MTDPLNRSVPLIHLLTQMVLTSVRTMVVNQQPNRPRIGLALSGGAARGIAHVGVLRALEEHNIPIDAIAGASAGALIGGCYATGLSIERLEQMARTFRWRHTSRLSFTGLGLQSNAHMEKFLRRHLPVTRFEDLKIPMAVMVTDLQRGASIIYRDQGDLPFAIRASCCVPALYTPARDDQGRYLIDGGIVKNLPISETRDLGADIVIGVDVNFEGATFLDRPRTALGVLTYVFVAVERIVSNQERDTADLVIGPKTGHIRWDQTRRSGELVELGYQATIAAMDDIKKLVSRSSAPSRTLESLAV